MSLETFKLLYLAIGPGIALTVYLYYSDKWDPEPKHRVIWCFVLGGLACFPTGYIGTLIENSFDLGEIFEPGNGPFLLEKLLHAFFGIALVEEFCKFFFIKAFIYDHREFNEPFDGVVYGGIVGCGFATVENLFYVLPLGSETGIFRIFTAVPGHVFEGMILGYFIGRARFSPTPKKYFTQGVFIVVVLHGIYDFSVMARASWSIYMVFVLVALGIYWGLHAKKEMEKHSEVIEFSKMEFALSKPGGRKEPMTLKDIRHQLSKGTLTLDEAVIELQSGREKSIKELFAPDLVSQYRNLPKLISKGQGIAVFMILYGLTFGLYFYVWFLKNYRRFRNYKVIDLNPELLTLILFMVATVPYFVIGLFPGAQDENTMVTAIRGILGLGIAALQTGFLYFQLKMIRRFLKRKLAGTFRPVLVAGAYFIFCAMIKLFPTDTPNYLIWIFLLVLLEGGVLIRVQWDLNRYWRLERAQSADL